MKKDAKFLAKLEETLGNINNKKKAIILIKYRTLIDEEKKNGKRIVDILKSLGDPEEIAKKELIGLKSKSFLKTVFIKKDDLKKAIEEDKELNKEKKKINVIKKVRVEKKKNDNKRKLVVKKYKKITKDFKQNINNFLDSSKDFFTKTFKRKKKDTFKETIKEVIDDSKNELSDALEVVTEKRLFEKKSTRIIRIIFKVICIIFILVLLFILLITASLFMSSIFAVLEGIKFYGINICLFGLVLLVLWLIIVFNRFVFNHKNSLKWCLTSLIVIFIIIGIGAAFISRELVKISTIKDVSEKYSMTTSIEKYKLPYDPEKKLIITFNSNYHTQYTIEYDKKLKDEIKLDVRYYECYYDFYVKRNSNNLYVSLKLDPRDRLAVYIDDLREFKVFDNDELSRYTVKIIVNEKYKDRIVIQ